MKVLIRLAVFLGLITPAFAANTPIWGKSGPWEVRIDPVLNGCFLVTEYTRGTVVRIGFNDKNKKGYLMLGNESWRSLELGKEYSLTFQFDSESPWQGAFTAISLGSSKALMIGFNVGNFLREFAAKQQVKIQFGDKIVTSLPLAGTYAAVQSLIKCQGDLGGLTASGVPSGRSDDPFARPDVTQASDPFSQ